VPGNPGQLNNVYDSVVALVKVNGNRIRGPYCTATFVSPRLLATAAHCIPAETRISMGPGITMVVPGAADQSSVGQSVQFITHRQYDAWRRVAGDEAPIPEYTQATVVGFDGADDHDVALLELAETEPDAEHWLEMRNLEEDPVVVGEEVYSIGMPVGQIWILTNGIISRIHLRMNGTIDILHQVRTGPGSSGSSIMDHRARIIAIVSASWGSTRSGSVVGQAKPISYVQTMIRVLETQREIEELDSGFVEQSRDAS